MKNISLILLFFSLRGFSQVIINDKFESTTLENKMSIFRDSTNSLTVNDIKKEKHKMQFRLITNSSQNFNSEKSTFWIKFEVNNSLKINQIIYLQISNPFIDNVAVYIIKQDSLTKESNFQYSTKTKQNFLSSFEALTTSIILLPNEQIEVFIKLHNLSEILSFNLVLASQKIFLIREKQNQSIYYTFLGLILTVILLSFAYYFIGFSSIYLYYALYVCFLGVAFWGVIGKLYNLSNFVNEFLTGGSSFNFYADLSLIFNILFLRALFKTSKRYSFYRNFGNIAIFLIISHITYIVFNLNSFRGIFRFINFYSVWILTIIITLFYHFKRNYHTSILYAISLIPIFVLLIVRALSLLNFIEKPIKLSLWALPAVSFEFLILLVGLSKNFFDSINEKNVLKTKIITSQIETQETERKHIAQDLHDDLGATLSALKGRNKQENFSEETQDLLNKAITDLRAISRRLLPADFEMFGFIPSIEKYIADSNKQQKLKVTFIVFGEVVKLNTEKELNIYRIITELVNNSIKYSNGKNATAQLVYHEEYLFASVEDDGTVENKNENNLGIGLKNVISRLEYLNAIIIEKGGANGYSFIFEIPYKPNL